MDLQNTSLVTLKLLRLRKGFVYSLATSLVANSAAALKDLQFGYGVPRGKCAVQHFGLADPCERLPIVAVEAREDTVLCVGRLHPSKGQDILIDAISRLVQVLSDPQLRSRLGGNGRKRFLQEFELSRAVRAHATFLEDLTACRCPEARAVPAH
jgi:hypothetical protein